MTSVTSQEVASYLPTIERQARYIASQGKAEYDDLRQEGMIAAWLTLERGIVPHPGIIYHRMLDWVRYLGRQERGDAVGYERALPMEFPGEEL